MNTKPCGVRSASLTSPCFISNARSATAGARPRPVIGSSRAKRPDSPTVRPRVFATVSRSAGIVDLLVELVGDALRLGLRALPLDLILDLRA